MFSPGTLQIHPSLRCNLRCSHCYSSSGPDHRGALDLDLLRGVVDDAAALGYGSVAISGGEPLMYPGLFELLAHARAAGMRTLVTTNGTLANRTRLEPLVPVLDLLAFSLDGPPEVHNAVRGEPWAFDKLQAGLACAEDLAIPRGLLYTVTAASWPYVDWAAKVARHHGCSLLQLHAIEDRGRAASRMRDDLLGTDLLHSAYVAASLVAVEHRDALGVQLDLAHRRHLQEMETGSGALAEGRPPILVVEEDGAVVPFGHGFARSGLVTDLHRQRLADAYPDFLRHRLGGLIDFTERTRGDLLRSERMVFDWYAELVEASRVAGATAVQVSLTGGARSAR